MRLDTVEGAILFATRAHDGQVDKGGNPYILHPLRVGGKLHDYSDKHVIAGILHDVVEDTHHTLDDLRTLGAHPDVITAVDSVTKTESERTWDAYQRSLDRALLDPIGAVVKSADIADNYGRIDSVTDPVARQRLADKYEKAVAYMAEHGYDPVRFM